MEIVVKGFSTESKPFDDILLLDKAIFCHFKIFEQIKGILFGYNHGKRYKHNRICSKETLFRLHNCRSNCDPKELSDDQMIYIAYKTRVQRIELFIHPSNLLTHTSHL